MASPIISCASPGFLFAPSSSGRTGRNRGGGGAWFRPGEGEQQKRWVGVAVKRRYKGTARREEALAELIEEKVAEAMEACQGGKSSSSTGMDDEQEEGCRVAWDEVEEVSKAKADFRRRLSESPADPLEPFCAHNPLSDDCTVIYEDDP